MDINLVGKCGIFCGACSIYRAQRDNENERKTIAKEHNCSVEQVRCNGCGALTTECWCNGCKILSCLERKGFEFCYQCNEFDENTCVNYNNLERTYLKAGEDIRDNILKFKAGLTKEWLLEQDKMYRCSTCDHNISVWDDCCPNCGEKLK